MNGALMKASSRFAIAAALGLVVGVGSVRAADLGGNCCADLEERVAELEATTARKGNRKMSLTITGQVNRVITWWDDGHSSKVYYGLDNTNSSSRFSLLGEARVNPSVKMGFEIMIEIEVGGTSSKASQFDEDGKNAIFGVAALTAPGATVPPVYGVGLTSANSANVDAYFGDARRVAWWIEHKDLGRLTVGRFESAGVVNTIDLAGISVVGGSSSALLNGSFFIRDALNRTLAVTFATIGDPAATQGRSELVRYDSPSWNGFIYSSSVGEAGDYWGTMLRYASEFSGFRVAAGIGYERISDRASGTVIGPLDAGFFGIQPDITAWGGSLAFLHVSSGLFIQGHYLAADYFNPVAPGAGSNYWGQTLSPSTVAKSPANQWLIQGGIAKNWFGVGNTALYAEYGVSNDWGASAGAGRQFDVDPTTAGCQVTSPAGPLGSGLTGLCNVTDTKLTLFGLGIVQNFDAAATELYLGYRKFEPEITNAGVGVAVEDFHQITGGARVKF